MENLDFLRDIKFTNETWMIIIPLILMAFDIATGSLNAWVKKDFKSFKMREGLVKKVGELFVLAIGEIFTIGISFPKYVMWFLSIYIIVMELVSICENLKKMGVPIPKFISKALSNAQDKLDEKLPENKYGENNGDNGKTK